MTLIHTPNSQTALRPSEVSRLLLRQACESFNFLESNMRTLVGVCLVWFMAADLLAEETWRQFRGPDGQGHSEATNLPITWSETENILWKAAVPGRGWSSPVFADGKIWLTTAVENQLKGEELEKARTEKLSFNHMAKQMNVVGSVTIRAV